MLKRAVLGAVFALGLLAQASAAKDRPRLVQPRGDISDRTPTFEWSGSSGAATYTLYLSSTPTFVPTQAFSGILTTYYALPLPLDRDATYYYRLEALRANETVITI